MQGWELPGSPMWLSSPSSAGGANLIPDQELRFHTPHGPKPEM